MMATNGLATAATHVLNLSQIFSGTAVALLICVPLLLLLKDQRIEVTQR